MVTVSGTTVNPWEMLVICGLKSLLDCWGTMFLFFWRQCCWKVSTDSYGCKLF